jgi:FkbM family methyltransferase
MFIWQKVLESSEEMFLIQMEYKRGILSDGKYINSTHLTGMHFLLKLLFFPPVNFVLSRSLRPFHACIPVRYQFPVNGIFRLRVSDRTSLLIETNYTSHLGRLLFWQGIRGFEYPSVRLFMELVKDAQVFMDIGANFGYYSLLAAALNNRIRIVAFEPLPAARWYFQKNIRLNNFKNILVEPLALAGREGEMDFFIPVSTDFPELEFQLPGDGSLVNYDESRRKGIRVGTTTLDRYVQLKAIPRIDIIKIDTETTEHLILEHGREVLSRCRPLIFCEVIRGYKEEKVTELLKQERYLFFEVSENGLREIPALTESPLQKNDFILIPEEKKGLIGKFVN